MTDKDVVERAAALLKCSVKATPGRKAGHKPIYRAQIAGPHAIGWMQILYTLMGERRQAKIREILGLWKSIESHRPYEKCYAARYGDSLQVAGGSV